MGLSKTEIFIKLLPIYTDAALESSANFEIDFEQVWEFVRLKTEPLLQLKVYLLCRNRPDFTHFIEYINECIETRNNRNFAIFIDACADYVSKLGPDLTLQIMAQLQNRDFTEAKVINVTSRFCSLSVWGYKNSKLHTEIFSP